MGTASGTAMVYAILMHVEALPRLIAAEAESFIDAIKGPFPTIGDESRGRIPAQALG
jgi:hypothetical protein